MRGLLQRFLNDTGEDIWTEDQLNSLLNLGTIDIQDFIEATEPDAFVYVDRRDIDAGERYYQKPAGMTSERELSLLGSDGEYSKLTLSSYEVIRRGNAPDPSYAHFGKYFYLSWVPPALIANGLEVVYHPTLAMADDSDVPDIHMRLHYAIVLAAGIKGLRETPDSELTKSFKEDLAIEVKKIPTLYLRSAAGNLDLSVDMGPYRANY
jgi:hypothetical protein